MKKVLFTISNVEARGGTERTTYIVASGLAEKGYNVYLFSTKGEIKNITYKYSDKINIVLQRTSKNKLMHALFYVLKLRKVLLEKKITTLVTVEVMSLFFTLPSLFLTFRRKAITYIVWEHFNASVTLGNKIRAKCRTWASRYASNIVTLTVKDIELWKEKFSNDANYIAIPNASPFEIYEGSYKMDSKKIISVGRLTYQKGFDRLMDLIALLIKEHNIKGWCFQIIGSGEDSEILIEKIKTLKIEDYVEMIPNTPKIKEYYEQASFMCMTSRFEGLPMTLIEAQSFGLPIIAYDCLTGPSEVISKENGFLIENGNQEEFIDKLKELIDRGNLRKQMSVQAKKSVEKFNTDKIIRQWEGLIK